MSSVPARCSVGDRDAEQTQFHCTEELPSDEPSTRAGPPGRGRGPAKAASAGGDPQWGETAFRPSLPRDP